METLPATTSENTHIVPGKYVRSPYLTYMAKLKTNSSRTTMTGCLARIVGIVTGKPVPKSGRDKVPFVDAFPWAVIRAPEASAIHSALAERFRPGNADKHINALRGLMEAAETIEAIAFDDLRRIQKSLPLLRVQTITAGRMIDIGELFALVRACEHDPSLAGVRDGCLIALLHSAGLRRQEVAGLDFADVDLDTGELKVRKGKGRKERTVHIANGALDALRDWAAVRGTIPGAFLLPVDKAGRIGAVRLSTTAISHAIERRRKQVGVRPLTPHDFRRTYASELLDRGTDLVTLSSLMGHESTATTARYDRRGEEAKRKAASLLHFPYARRG